MSMYNRDKNKDIENYIELVDYIIEYDDNDKDLTIEKIESTFDFDFSDKDKIKKVSDIIVFLNQIEKESMTVFKKRITQLFQITLTPENIQVKDIFSVFLSLTKR